MGEPNNVLNVYMSKAERIGSVLEYYLKKKLPPDWNCCEEDGFYTVKNSRGKMSYRQRDIIRRVKSGECDYLLGIEKFPMAGMMTINTGLGRKIVSNRY